MPRGKEAAKAARRRHEMAMEHIDRLTDDVVSHKLRAKQVEGNAAMVPGLQRRIRELEQQLAEEITPLLATERRNHDLMMVALKERVSVLLEIVTRLWAYEWNNKRSSPADFRDRILSSEDIERLDELFPKWKAHAEAGNRENRRSTQKEIANLMGQLDGAAWRGLGMTPIKLPNGEWRYRDDS